MVEDLILPALLPPENHLRDLPGRFLHLQHCPQIQDRIRYVDARPGDHVETGVPEPLVRAVLHKARSVEMVVQTPLASLE